MRIGIDARPLLDTEPSGVGEYTREMIRALFEIDSENEYALFANSYAKAELALQENRRAEQHLSRIPNKILNTSMRFLNYPIPYALPKPCDLFWMPNINFIALDRHTPLALTIHDLSFKLMPDFYSKKQRMWHNFVRPDRLIRKAEKIIVPSISTRNDLLELGAAKEKIAVINHGIAREFFEPADPLELEAAKSKYDLPARFILCLAELGPRKNIDSALAAFQLIKKDPQFADLHLIIAGKTIRPLPAPLYNSGEWSTGIKFLGYVPAKDRRALYRQAQVFVYPSYYEGFGLPPLEAQACGTPVVAGNRGSLPEILEASALLADPYNIEDIARAIREVLRRPALYEKLKTAGLINAKRFSWLASAKQTLSAFKETYESRN